MQKIALGFRLLTARRRPFSRDRMELARHDSDILRPPLRAPGGADGSSEREADRGTPQAPLLLPPILPRSNLTPTKYKQSDDTFLF